MVGQTRDTHIGERRHWWEYKGRAGGPADFGTLDRKQLASLDELLEVIGIATGRV